MTPIKWVTRASQEREDAPKCTKHPKTVAVTVFKDELTGTEVNACKRCRLYYDARKGWRRAT